MEMFLRKLPVHKPRASFLIEKQFAEDFILGLDEVGRGPLAGPVVCAGVCFGREAWDDPELKEIQDSKLVPESKRQNLVELIQKKAKWHFVQFVHEAIIDQINILQASLRGFFQIYEKAKSDGLKLHALLIDGNQSLRKVSIAQRPVIGGDRISTSIAAASILAKVARDDYMKREAIKFPEYGFERHKGYGTKAHWHAIESFGPCRLHRRSFLKRYFSKNKGAQSEAFVEEHLVNNGWQVVERNWRHREGEIDLIVRNKAQLRFVEVRSSEDSEMERVFPVEKQKQIKKCVQLYLSSLESRPSGVQSIHCDFYHVRGGSLQAFPDVFKF